MINIFLDSYKNIDKSIKRIMINGFKFSFITSILSIIILITYNLSLIPILYNCGTLLFKSSLMFWAVFLTMGFSFDKIKKLKA